MPLVLTASNDLYAWQNVGALFNEKPFTDSRGCESVNGFQEELVCGKTAPVQDKSGN
jgi:hypothetical protein